MQNNQVPAKFYYVSESNIFSPSGRVYVKVIPTNITAQAIMLDWIASMCDENHQEVVYIEKLEVIFQVFGLFETDEYWEISCPVLKGIDIKNLQIPQNLEEAIFGDLANSNMNAEQAVISRCIEKNKQ